MQAKLIVTGGKASKKELSLDVPLTVGRSRRAGLTIAHPMVSRQHCEIYEADGLLRIRDLGSTNGTYVSGKKVNEAVLRPHDRFTIGPLTFEVDYPYAGDLTVAQEKHEDYAAGLRGTALAPEALDEMAAPPEESFAAPSEEEAAFDFLVASPPSAVEPAASAEPPGDAAESPEASPMASPEPADLVQPEPRREEEESTPSVGKGEGEASEPPQVAPPAREDLPPAVPTWEAPDDVPPLEVVASDSDEQPPPETPPDVDAGIALPDGEMPDFHSWSDVPAGPLAAAGVSDAADLAGWGAAASEESPLDSQSGAWDDSPGEAPTAALAPVAPTVQPKTKKGWWPFGKGKAGAKSASAPTKGLAPANSKSLTAEPPEAPPAPPSDAQAESGLPTPPSPSQEPAHPASPRDDAQSDLDEFLNSLR